MPIADSILTMFSWLGEWITTNLAALSELFYVPDQGLTFFGILAVIGLGFSVVFLLLRIIQNFLHFRG